ncbi:MAG: carbon-nitrogen hydrolase family protein [Nannocystaceae bacterium]
MTVRNVAVVQAFPKPRDLPGSLAIALSRIREAAAGGAQVIAFGESWLAGYPAWLDHCPGMGMWDNPATKEVFAELRASSVVVPGPQTHALGALCKSLGVVVTIGVNERVDEGPGNGTLFNTLLTFDATGELVTHHRKLVPTYTERLVWGPGDAHGLRPAATKHARVGGLICWEHWMPLARQALHIHGEQIHVAVWPTAVERHQLASRHYAFEARCFVLVGASLLAAEDLPPQLERRPGLEDPKELILMGGSAIIGPDGTYIVEPVYDQEAILTAEIDLRAIDREKMTLDVAGHYSRPDLLELRVNPGPARKLDI